MLGRSRAFAVRLMAVVLIAGGCAKSPPTKETTQVQPETPRPNVVLISIDTLRADRPGCYGYSRPITPNIDRLAERALVFTNCRSQATWTLPSHMSMLTSMMPASNGVDSLNKILPTDIPTLAELLQEDGIRTAAFVNNAQMRAHWGFDRGFDVWREFQVDQPEGNCESITAAAIDWLNHREEPDDEPFFLFLHYYDPHDPYAAPDAVRESSQVTLTGEQARQLCVRNRFPDSNATAGEIADLQRAYDAEIRWVDREVGRLLARLDDNTMVVVVSDHGEAFEEHGWMLHGATLYEEEVHVPLIVRLPRATTAARRRQSVMLMDVAPTILEQLDIPVPASFQGRSLLQADDTPRAIPAESKAPIEGRYSVSTVVYPLKAVYWLFEGRTEVFRLPDETTPLATVPVAVREAVVDPLREWIETEQFWMIHACGDGEFDATVEFPDEPVGLFIPVDFDAGRDRIELQHEGRQIRWRVYPGGKTRSLFLQLSGKRDRLRVTCEHNGEPAADVFVGANLDRARAMPLELDAAVQPVSPLIERRFSSDEPGFFIQRHASGRSTPRRSMVRSLDAETLRQLKSLGYTSGRDSHDD